LTNFNPHPATKCDEKAVGCLQSAHCFLMNLGWVMRKIVENHFGFIENDGGIKNALQTWQLASPSRHTISVPVSVHMMLAVVNVALQIVCAYYQALVVRFTSAKDGAYLCLFILLNHAQPAVVDCRFIHVCWVRMLRVSTAEVNSWREPATTCQCTTHRLIYWPEPRRC